ncbi:hypothetical protein CC1G_14414 [Coprinopsis cinerea okayama7|uniref:Uncharacterized protein n=1 Tax=Coprinopsis cinerea (strain Okayama-7 / 130 / ATCC MYA-4618 / FGSC 9003) TaxID=240176 RepID=D6RM25_COPC7|nr:hypothetical protein CC1G_14414 [Coprinopsis cinerea okayama7\|eukprot:XP_002911417.1 hypothetical protein CC1G_14414 [Coprinopsis cinerea okayama7\
MKILAAIAALISAIPAISGLVINTPSGVVQCQPIMITFGSGSAPYYISAIPAGQVSASPLRTWDPTNAQSLTWNVDMAGGTAISFIVKDSTGAQAYSDQVTIQGSNDSSCLNASSTAAHATASAVATGSAASHASGAVEATTASAGRAAATQTTSSNAANGNAVHTSGGFQMDVGAHWVGVVGVIGGLLL